MYIYNIYKYIYFFSHWEIRNVDKITVDIYIILKLKEQNLQL